MPCSDRWLPLPVQVRGVLGDDAVPDPWRTFPGSQPVSLDRQNLSLLHRERYWVTWKADGTRYMLLIMRLGTYLVDRSFKVRRLQVQAFPGESCLTQRHVAGSWAVTVSGCSHRRLCWQPELDTLPDAKSSPCHADALPTAT